MALVKCSECGHEVSDKAKTCPNCGCPVVKELVCKECGSHVNQMDKVCPNCGNPIKNNWPFDVKTRKILMKYLVTGLVAILITCSVFFVYNLLAKSNVTVSLSSEFCEAIRQYDELDEFHEGMAAVRRGNKWGYIDHRGKEVIPCQYDMHVGIFSEGLACVPSKEYPKIEFINKEGKVVLKGDYCFSTVFLGSVSAEINLRLPNFKNGLCLVSTDFSKGDEEEDFFIDTKGNKVIENAPQKTPQSEYKSFEKDGKFGLKDAKGRVIIEAKYDILQNGFSNGVALAMLRGGDQGYDSSDTYAEIYGYVDMNGLETFTQADYERIVQTNEKWEEMQIQVEEERKIEAARQEYLERERKKELQLRDWMQGTWIYSSYGINVKVVISKNLITCYMNDRIEYSGKYEIRGDKLHYNVHNGMSDCIILDYNTKRLKADNTHYFTRVGSNNAL